MKFALVTLFFLSTQVMAASDMLPPWQRPLPAGTSADRDATVISENLPPWQRQLGGTALVATDSDEGETTAAADGSADGADVASSDKCLAAAKSQHAVGNPCATSKSFMKSLGMNDAEIARVEAMTNAAH